jgi:serine/threonine protein kinase
MDYIGKQIGKYTIKRLIGEGGMASVFEGEHEILGTKAAIKILNPILSANKQIRERFKNEAKLMASLDHPNITRVLDFEENDSYLAIAMELLSGEDLSDRIKGQGKLTEKEIIHVFEQTLSAFEYAHNLGIVHRDIKPSNIFMLPNGTIKILDFGIAKLFGQGNEMTQTGTQMGTPIYMSPEQVKADKTVDHRSDIYSLGVTLYYALIGKPPYDGNTSSQFDIFTKIVHEPLPEIESTSYLADLIRKACQKDREQRFQSCDEWLQALKLGVAPKVETSAAEKTIIETPNVQSGDQTIIETSASSDNDKTELETNSQNARNNTDSKQPLGAPEAKNNDSNNQKKEGDNPAKKNKTWIIIALIVAVVGIGIGIFFMLNEKEGSKKEGSKKGAWSDEDKEKFQSKCKDELGKIMGENTNKLCDCMLEKVEDEFETYDEADKGMNNEVGTKIAEECATQVMKDALKDVKIPDDPAGFEQPAGISALDSSRKK